MSEPKRIQLKRTKGWRKPEGAIVVARPSKWGNPFTVTAVGSVWVVNTPLTGLVEFESQERAIEFAVALYRDWIRLDPRQRSWPGDWNADIAELRGHNLACWCPLDQPCHADVLLEVANR